MKYEDIELLKGKVLANIEINKEDAHSITFTTSEGERYLMHHQQDCCETVEIESISGEIDDLIGYPLLMAEVAESGNSSDVDEVPQKSEYDDGYTWTFYKFATIKGYVDIRWYGSSNGYYSESVNFVKLKS